MFRSYVPNYGGRDLVEAPRIIFYLILESIRIEVYQYSPSDDTFLSPLYDRIRLKSKFKRFIEENLPCIPFRELSCISAWVKPL